MSAVAYLQGAASQVANAATDLDRQIKEIRTDLDNFKRESERHIVQLQTELAGLQAQESATSDNSQRDDLKRQENDLQKQIEQLKQEQHKKQQESEQAISYKQVYMNKVSQMSRDIYTLSSDPNAY